jgi:hypothetical protein
MVKMVAAGILVFQSLVADAQLQYKKNAGLSQTRAVKKYNRSCVQGYVYHYNTTIPVSKVGISIMGSDITSVTDAKGRFRLTLPASPDSIIMLIAQVAPTCDTFFVEQQQVSLADVQSGKNVILYAYYEEKMQELTIKTYGSPIDNGRDIIFLHLHAEDEIIRRWLKTDFLYQTIQPIEKKQTK